MAFERYHITLKLRFPNFINKVWNYRFRTCSNNFGILVSEFDQKTKHFEMMVSELDQTTNLKHAREIKQLWNYGFRNQSNNFGIMVSEFAQTTLLFHRFLW